METHNIISISYSGWRRDFCKPQEYKDNGTKMIMLFSYFGRDLPVETLSLLGKCHIRWTGTKEIPALVML